MHQAEWPSLRRLQITCWSECGEKGTLLHFWWMYKLCSQYGKDYGGFLRKLKIEIPYDPTVLLLGIYSEKTLIQKEVCTPVFTAVLFRIAKTWKHPKYPSTDE